SLASQFQRLVSDQACSDALSWSIDKWTVQWPEGATQSFGGTGQSPLAATHDASPQPGVAEMLSGDALVTAVVHVRGIVLDFDSAGNIVQRASDVDVVISSRASTGVTYVPPVLNVGAEAIGQAGDATVASVYSVPIAASSHVDAIRGRLLTLYPRALINQRGEEINGDGS